MHAGLNIPTTLVIAAAWLGSRPPWCEDRGTGGVLQSGCCELSRQTPQAKDSGPRDDFVMLKWRAHLPHRTGLSEISLHRKARPMHVHRCMQTTYIHIQREPACIPIRIHLPHVRLCVWTSVADIDDTRRSPLGSAERRGRGDYEAVLAARPLGLCRVQGLAGDGEALVGVARPWQIGRAHV